MINRNNVKCIIAMAILLICHWHVLMAGKIDPSIREIINSATYEKDGSLPTELVSTGLEYRLVTIPFDYYHEVYNIAINRNEILLPVIIATKGGSEDFAECNIEIKSKVNDLVTATINLEQLFCLEAKDNIKQIGLCSKLMPLLDTSIKVIRANDVRDSFNLTGAGIILGIIDIGLDLQNRDFMDSNSMTRVLYFWDQMDSSGMPPCFNYGTEWFKSQIDSGICTHNVRSTHGTNVAGIACGNGQQTFKGISAGTFSGIAKNADIIFVNTTARQNDVIDAFEYIGLKADSLEKPWVANLSMGIFWGPRDGTSLFEQGVSSIVNQDIGKGHVAVIAAGNENYGHCQKEYFKNHAHRQDSSSVIIQLAGSPIDTLDKLNLEIWYDETDNFSVSVMAPSGHIYGPYGPNDGTGIPGYGLYINQLDSTDGLVCIHNDHWGGLLPNSHPYTPDRQIIIKLLDRYIDTAWYHLRPGDWTVTLFNDFGEWDLYLLATRDSNNTGIVSWGHENNGKITEPGNAYNIITVGSFNSKRVWKDASNYTWQTSCIRAWELADTSHFSSRGPTRDGRAKPDILAPGALIGTSIPSGFYSDLSFNPKLLLYDSAHYITEGTSMATPHISGIVALMLQKNPDLTYSEILNCLQSTSVNGKVDAFEAIKCIPSPPCQGRCGDANHDGSVNISDAVKIINHIFLGQQGPQPILACGDANSDGSVNVTDAVVIMNFVYLGNPGPTDCSPGSWTGQGGNCCPY